MLSYWGAAPKQSQSITSSAPRSGSILTKTLDLFVFSLALILMGNVCDLSHGLDTTDPAPVRIPGIHSHLPCQWRTTHGRKSLDQFF